MGRENPITDRGDLPAEEIVELGLAYRADLEEDQSLTPARFLEGRGVEASGELAEDLTAIDVEVARQRGRYPKLETQFTRLPGHREAVIRGYLQGVAPDGFIDWRNSNSPADAESVQSPQPGDALLPGRVLLGPPLGSGSYGVVYPVYVEETGHYCAVKVPRLDRISQKQARELLLQEAKTARKVDHPCVCKLLEVHRDERWGVALEFEYIDGAKPVDTWCEERHGGMPGVYGLLKLFVEIAEAVGHAHDQQLVHRDLSPNNLLVDKRGRPRVIDFGCAVATGQAHEDSRGTPPYMAPEQWDAQRSIGPSSDVYALGVLLHQLLCGRLPFPEDKRADQGPSQPRSLTRTPSSWNPAITEQLDEVLSKSLAYVPEDRYASGQALARALLRVRDEDYRQSAPSKDDEASISRRPLLLGSAALLGAILVAGLAYWGGPTVPDQPLGLSFEWKESPLDPNELALPLSLERRAPYEGEQVILTPDFPEGSHAYLLHIDGGGEATLTPEEDLDGSGLGKWGWTLPPSEPSQTFLLVVAARPLSTERQTMLCEDFSGLGASPRLGAAYINWRSVGGYQVEAKPGTKGPSKVVPTWADRLQQKIDSQNGLKVIGRTIPVQIPR